jgi:adenosylcobyric acid synthase
MCLEPEEQARIKGFILNKFRGDQALLGNAMDWLQARTGIPTVAIVPMIHHTLPEEDTFHHRAEPVAGKINLALILYPYASNVDEFDPLIHTPGVNVVPVRAHTSLDDYAAILLPGSKNTVESLRALQQNGLAAELMQAAARGKVILGVCGGMQLLGRSIGDPHNLEGGDSAGLGLLDLTTTLEPYKITCQRTTQWLGGSPVHGYEIHHGKTQASAQVQAHLADDLGWRQGNVYGVYLHGLLENTPYRQWFLGQCGWYGEVEDWSTRLDAELDRLAELVTTTRWADVLEQRAGAATPVTLTHGGAYATPDENLH